MNLPNVITLSRVIFLAAIFVLIYQRWPGAATIAFVCAFLGAVSDWLDGWLARRYNQISNFGKIMDAAIDKIFVLGLLGLLLHIGLLPMWGLPLLALIIARDLVITVIRAAAAQQGKVLAADHWGKRKTIWQVTCICVLFFVPVIERDLAVLLPGRWELLATFVWMNGVLYFILSSVLAIYSGALYLIRSLPLLRRRKKEAL